MEKHVWSKTPLLCLRECNFSLTGKLFVLSHLYGELWKKGDVLGVCGM